MLMIINPLEPISIVEQDRLLLAQIDQNTDVPPIKAFDKFDASFLVKMHQVATSIGRKFVPPRSELREVCSVHKVLPEENHADVSGLIPCGHRIRKATL